MTQALMRVGTRGCKARNDGRPAPYTCGMGARRSRETRRLSGEEEKITFRLPALDRRDAARLARMRGVSLSEWVREAVREKLKREGGNPPS